ncbi:hypothetical protein B0H11DRAFT_2237643 [Mycena galericulata]|nr:hypothetical protein B0H11DRAFT_2237643 [Mycena galericulata]
MVEVFAKRWGNHSSFKTSVGRLGITISHFSGPVMYSVEGFLAHNLDALNPDFVSLVRNAGTVGSVNPFVKGLYSGKAIATTERGYHRRCAAAWQAHARAVDTAEEHPKHGTPLSPRGAGGVILEDNIDGGAEEGVVGAGSSSGVVVAVSNEFRAALDTLFAMLNETQA